MNLTKIVSIVLLLIAVALAGYLWDSISDTIKQQQSIKVIEGQITEKLEVIREAQKAFREQYGRYTSNWDSLINFIQTAEVPITVRTETIIPLSYGRDSIRVEIDTLGFVPAKDRIFKKTTTINAADDGTFLGFAVKVGDEVVKNAKSYSLRRESNNRVEDFVFLDKGTISGLANVKPGDKVTKGQYLITLWDYQFDPNIDISRLAEVPGSDGKKFGIYTGKIDRNGVLVDVIHVWDPDPINPARRPTNEARNRQPLQFGSKTDVNTSGNWE
jgi:biotin carboxyl carrier protein